MPTHLVEFVLQHTGVQAQLAKAVLLHRLNDTIHLCIVLGRQVGEVDMRRDELSAEHTSVEVAQDLLRIPAQEKNWRCGKDGCVKKVKIVVKTAAEGRQVR